MERIHTWFRNHKKKNNGGGKRGRVVRKVRHNSHLSVRRVSALASAMVGGAKKKRMQARKRSAGVCIYDVVQKEAER